MILPQTVNGLEHDDPLQLSEFVKSNGGFAFFIALGGRFINHFSQPVTIEAV